jgi:dienelactone hydrolase
MVAGTADGVDVRDVPYEADGLQLVGTLAVPDGPGPHPGVLIGHEGPGLDDVQRRRASDVAGLGYIGFALDYHGQLSPFSSRDDMNARLDELSANPERTRTLGRAALDVVVAEPSVDPSRVAAIGYCYGATVALELARSGADLQALVGFHPGMRTIRPADAANIRGRVLMLIGADDPIIPVEHRLEFEQEMRNGGVDWQMHLYGGVVHSFTHPNASRAGIPGIGYDEAAATHAWAAMASLLSEVFASRGQKR